MAILASSGKNKAAMFGECTIAANVTEPVKLWTYFTTKDAKVWKCTPVYYQLKAGDKVTISSNDTIATNCEGALKIYYTVGYRPPGVTPHLVGNTQVIQNIWIVEETIIITM